MRLALLKLNCMMFSTWLDAEKGRTKAVAEHFGRTPSAISQWRDGVPPKRMLEVVALTDGAVSIEEMLRESAKQAPAKTEVSHG